MMESAKKFLLVMPDYSDFPDLFIKNLKFLGFETQLMTDEISPFKYQRADRIINFYRKTFLKDKHFKKKLVAAQEERKLLELVKCIQQTFDYTLVIRPDAFPVSVIKELKSKSRKFIAYQWDGIEKFPDVKNYFKFFDSFFCFENVPGVANIKKTTNFYFDSDGFQETDLIVQNPEPVFYFVGLDWENRREKIDKFVEFALLRGFKLDIYLQEFDPNPRKNPTIKYINQRITFAENIENVRKSDVLLDFIDPRHNGLSIRFFEAMHYRKKIITDNPEVRNYDFYHPDNIFILYKDNFSGISEFVRKPYFNLPENVVRNYSFSEWIKRIIAD